MRRRVAYILPDRPWWEDLASSFALALVVVVAMMVAGFLFAGCGDNIECPPEPPAACVPASGATIVPCPENPAGQLRYTCAGFVETVGCTVPVRLASGELADALCVSSCEVAP